MKISTAVLALTAGSAAAFAPASQQKTSTATSMAGLDDMPGALPPLGKFDPLGYANLGDETLRWFRAAELKHGRCAMVACTGFLLNLNGIHFPGLLSTSPEVSFESLSKMHPADAWAATPDVGKAQIIGTILVAEIASEMQGTHYMKGGEYPTIVFPSGLEIAKAKTDAELLSQKNKELQNGRLAQIGIMSFISEYNIPGSVPGLAGIEAFHSHL